MREIKFRAKLPHSWSDRFLKSNVTPIVKRDHKCSTAKCIGLERLDDGETVEFVYTIDGETA